MIQAPPQEHFTRCMGDGCVKKYDCLRHLAWIDGDDFGHPVMGTVCATHDHVLFFPKDGVQRD